ncbi:MAG TPA: sugar transferase [Candidatus Limnocylindrales bacterium]|nr:sugar transferase [Candidatus Limnocylindrales bacterium]
MSKRLFDFITGTVLLILFSPVMLVLAMIIRFQMGSPVIFKQLRPGLNEKPFYLYKFRTMIDQAGSRGEYLDDSQRLTLLGRKLRKYSLDELPQVFNVIKGDLSLVGPRPLLMAYLERYTPEQARRHDVKPGITGWAQINGRNVLTWEEKFALDVWYVDHRNFWLDFKVLWLTLFKVLKAEGISQDGWATSPEFMGTCMKHNTPADNRENI